MTDETPDFPDEPAAPPVQKASWGSRILLALLTISGVGAVLCCGGLVYIFNKFQGARTTDPAEIQQIRGRIVTVKLPKGFKPVGGLEMDGVLFIPPVKMVVFRYTAEEDTKTETKPKSPKEENDEARMRGNFLMLGAIKHKRGKEKLEERAAEQGKTELKILEEREVTVSIDGENVPFSIVRGKMEDSERVLWQVSGDFAGSLGIRFLFLQLRDKDWDEDMVLEILRSIQ